ncbi:hypothetical protein [Gallibacterium anatis]|uniref:hypothetical protein n=1 Tax=Gallibacterium anatis TaxID=750 RepID=UPI003006F34A
MTTSQKIKLGEIKGLIAQIKALSEAGGLNAVSMTEKGKSKPVSRTGIFKSINTIAALAEIEMQELAESIEQTKTLLEIASNQGGQVTDKDGKPLSVEEVLDLAFDVLTEAETHLTTLIQIEAEGKQ